MSETINPLTGLPIGGQPTTSTTTGTEMPINPITGKSMQAPVPQINLGNPGYDEGFLLGKDYQGTRDLDKFKKYNVPRGQLLDWEEIRARNQSTADQWGNGLAKMGATTLGAVAENTLGVLFGLGSLASGGEYYDNAVGRTVDKTNEWMRENMPNYYTREQENMSTLSKLGTANFWADTFANGVGYSLGSIGTMYLTGGLGAVGMLDKAGKAVIGANRLAALSKGVTAITNGTKLAQTLNSMKGAAGAYKTFLSSVDGALMMSLAEASVEARETQKSTFKDLTDAYISRTDSVENLGQIPLDILEDIEKTSYAAGNTNFITQLPVLAGTNFVMFGKQVMGYNTAARVNSDVIFDAASKKAVSKFANDNIWTSVRRRMVDMGKEGATEAFQESFQFASNKFASTYHSDRYKNGGVGDMANALNTSMSETFGSQEGLESALVGFLVGALMRGGGAVASKEYSNRKQMAQTLADVRNGGFLDNAKSGMLNMQAQSDVVKRMHKALQDDNKKLFKDLQYQLIQINALHALDTGTFDVYMEQLENTKQLPDADFAKRFGYTDENGNPLQELTDTKDKTKIIDGLKTKLEGFRTMYNNVSNSIAIKPPAKGLPRLLQDEATRKAEDTVYNSRLALRNELILRGSSVQNKTKRLTDMQKEMQSVIDNSLTANNKMMEGSLDMNAILDEFSLYKTDPGTAEEGYDANEARTKMIDNLDNAVKELGKIDPIAAAQLLGLAQDYANIAGDVTQAVDVYNQLSSSESAREQFEKERTANEATIQNQERQKKYKEGLDKSKTTKEIEELFKDASKEDKALAQKKYDELEKVEQEAYEKYLKIAGTSIDEKIENLREISKQDLNPAVKEGLNKALEHYESIKKSDENGEIDVLPEENANDTVTDKKKEGYREEAFSSENIGRFESIEGRTVHFDGTKLFIRESNPVDSIGFGKDGKPVSVTLVDENGNTRKIITPQAEVEAIAAAILLEYAAKMGVGPAITDTQGEPLVNSTPYIAAKRTKLAYKGKYGELDTQSLKEKLYELDKLLVAVNENIDSLIGNVASSNKTKEQVQLEIFTEGDIVTLKKEAKKIRTQITKIKNVLGARGESFGLTSDQLSNLEERVLKEVSDLEAKVTLSENSVVDLNEKIEETQELIKKYEQEGDTEALEAANRDLKSYQEKVKDEQRSIEENKAFINLERKNLKRIEDGKEKGSTDDAGQPAPSTAAETQEQVDAGQDQNIENRAQEQGDAQVAPRYQDDQVPTGREYFTVTTSDGEVLKLRVTTRLDGFSRSWEIMEGEQGYVPYGGDGKIADGSIIKRDNISTRQELDIFEKAGGVVTTDQTEGYEAVMNPKMFDRLTPDQQRRLQGNNEVNENTNVNDDAVSAQMQDQSATEKSAGPAEQITREGMQDLTMPPVEDGAPTLGQSLQEAIDRGEAAVPPQENGEELSLKMAGSANVIVDQVANRTRIQVSETGVPLEPIVDELIDVQAKNNLKPGDVLTVQIVEQEGFADTENLPLYLVNAEGKYVGKLAAAKGANAEAKLKDRQDIINKLRAGKEVQLGVKRVYAPNYNNARTENNIPFFSNPQEVFNGNPDLVFQTVTNGVRQLVTTEQGEQTFLGNEVEGNDNRRGLTTGQVGFLIPSNEVPGGQPTFSTASTADLSPQAQQKVLDALREGDFDTAKQIVANSTTRDAVERKNDFRKSEFLEFGEFSDGQPYLVYKDAALNETVRMYGSQVQNALAGKPFTGQFVTLNSDGNYVSKPADQSRHDKLKNDFVNNFTNFLKDKKYNVDKSSATVPGEYTSPVTGVSYPSYKDYLFSPQETGGRLGILRTDLVRTKDGSLFHNPIVELTRGNILGETMQEAAQNTKFADGGAVALPKENRDSFADEMGDDIFGSPRPDFNNDCKS